MPFVFRRALLVIAQFGSISERFSGQLRLEMFNAFNQTNPICCTSNAVTSASYAKPSGTLTPRNLQIGMKVNI